MVTSNNHTDDYKSLQNVKSEYKNSILSSSTHDTLNLQEIESLFSNNPLFLRKVLVLHFIIMYYQRNHVHSYLESITTEFGLVTTHLMVNYPVDFNLINTTNFYSNSLSVDLFTHYSQYPRFEYKNSFNALHVAALWSNDENLIRSLCVYGAQVWITDRHEFYADELCECTPYFDHLLEYYSDEIRNNINGLNYAKRDWKNDSCNVNREISLISGETIPQDYDLQNWFQPLILPI